MASVLPSDIPGMSVRAIAAVVASGGLFPSDVAEAVLRRIDAVEERIRAWSYLDPGDVRKQAAVLTEEARAGRFRGPLHGVPVGIKDEFHVQGVPTGMRGLDEPWPEPQDATCVARLRAAGAIIVGKTHMPVRDRLPPTRNPWNQEHTAGGTSSGSGAAVAARMVPVALGEQTFGSNLRPAAYCGVAGLKPTYARVSRFGCLPFAWSMDHVGIIGLDAADMALVLSVIAGPDPLDPTALQDPPPPAELDMDAYRPPRLGLVRNFFPERSEPIMRDAVEAAATKLGGSGAVVKDVHLPEEFGLAWHAHRIIAAAEGSTLHAREHHDKDLPGSGGRIGSLLPATYYLESRRIRTWLTERLQHLSDEYDVLLMPTAPGPAPKGQTTGDARLLVPWSFLGFPAATVPCGLSPEGLPLGLQLVAGPRADHALLRAAAWCETALGPLPPPPL